MGRISKANGHYDGCECLECDGNRGGGGMPANFQLADDIICEKQKRISKLEDGVDLLAEKLGKDSLAVKVGGESLAEFIQRLLSHNPATCTDPSCGFCLAHRERGHSGR